MSRRDGHGGFMPLRAAAVWMALLGACIATGAQAVAPADQPLPSCAEVNGVRQGACPNEFSAQVTGTTKQRMAAGQALVLTTVPNIPQCTRWNQDSNSWTPSPCYSGFATPTIGGCAVIDLQDGGRFKRMPCPTALYKQSSATTSEQLFSKRRIADGNSSCGLRSFFWGDSETNRQGGNSWMQANASWLDCEITLKGARPDGLYGPTWVAVYVGIDIVTSGCCNADPRYPQRVTTEIFIPVDGDLRFSSDVGVDADASIRAADWDSGRVTAVYRATLQNRGSDVARSVELTVRLPSQLKYESASDASCTPNSQAAALAGRGGVVTCRGFDMAANSSRVIEVVARVLNATDLDGLQKGQVAGVQGVQMRAKADDDADASNNEVIARLDLPFRTGSFGATKAAMQALAPYFDYMAPTRFSQCNVYKDDIFKRLEAIHAQHPQVFANLSYGGVTSGEYYIGGVYRSGGHVGVVVYAKGTNYRQTGIIINGTPSNTPLSGNSVVGPGDANGYAFNGATSLDLRYLRTEADKFPGFPQEESGGQTGDYGFEGRYAHNSDQFGGVVPPAPAAATCPAAPDAVAVTTESPVDLVITNSRGQRVETQGGMLVTQQLDGPIHSMAIAHGDGTYGWTLVLPVDDYDVKLRGTQAGSYRLTMTTYAADGTPRPVVTSGTTSSGKVDAYQVDVPEVAPPNPTAPTTPPASGGSGGGGGFDALVLASLLGLLTMQRARKRRVTARLAAGAR
jgi:hypothetical protein